MFNNHCTLLSYFTSEWSCVTKHLQDSNPETHASEWRCQAIHNLFFVHHHFKLKMWNAECSYYFIIYYFITLVSFLPIGNGIYGQQIKFLHCLWVPVNEISSIHGALKSAPFPHASTQCPGPTYTRLSLW